MLLCLSAGILLGFATKPYVKYVSLLPSCGVLKAGSPGNSDKDKLCVASPPVDPNTVEYSFPLILISSTVILYYIVYR